MTSNTREVEDLLYDFYSEMKECEEENEMLSQSQVLKQQAEIVEDYATKLLATKQEGEK